MYTLYILGYGIFDLKFKISDYSFVCVIDVIILYYYLIFPIYKIPTRLQIII